MKLLKLHERQYTIHAVCDNHGNAALVDFLEDLGANLKANRDGMLALLDHCAENGPPRNADQKHHLEDGIFELKKGKLRVLYFTDKGKLIICSHGLIKKGQKIPNKEIRAAKRAQNRYQEARDAQRLEILEDDQNG